MTIISVAEVTKCSGNRLQIILTYSLVLICTVDACPSQHKLICTKIENDTTNFITVIRVTRLLNVTWLWPRKSICSWITYKNLCVICIYVYYILYMCVCICVHVCRCTCNYLCVHVQIREVIPQMPPTFFVLFWDRVPVPDLDFAK